MARVGGRLALPQNRFADARGTYKLSQRPLARNIVKPSYQAEAALAFDVDLVPGHGRRAGASI